MPLETTTYIEGLDQSWPLGGDPTNQGDNHLRLVKSVLKAQFPGVGGEGFNVAILATEAELNALVGLDTATSLEVRLETIEASIAALEGVLNAPVGTRMVFQQASTPPGWTQDVSNHDKMLRIVNTAGGGTGGVDSPVANDFVVAHSHGFTGNATGIAGGSHSHAITIQMYQSCGASSGCFAGPQSSCAGTCPATTAYSSAAAANIDHSHTTSGTVASAGTATGWRPKYMDTIIGIKD